MKAMRLNKGDMVMMPEPRMMNAVFIVCVFVCVCLVKSHFDALAVRACPAVIAANVFVEHLPTAVFALATSK
jgi:hypothetical protein